MANKKQPDSISMDPIGIVHSPFKEKFGIPRQPGLVKSAKGHIELCSPYNTIESVRGLEEVSHIWVSFVFHAVPQGEWHPTVRPPRLGGNTRVGVFASRSPYRPSRLGLSVLELDEVDTNSGVVLRVSGLDLMDGTPVLDIKPYVPYCDSIPSAAAGFAQVAPEPNLDVVFPDPCDLEPFTRVLIRDVLSHDIRPAYHDDESRTYGVTLSGVNVQWRIAAGQVIIDSIEAEI